MRGPYLEMFARTARPGWDIWLAEAELRQFGPRRWRAAGYPEATE